MVFGEDEARFEGLPEEEAGIKKEDTRTSGMNKVFSQLPQVEPMREVDVRDDDIDGGDGRGDIEDRLKSGGKLTDLQVIDRRLNPDLGYPFLNRICMSRVFPESYDKLFRILVKYLVRTYDVPVPEAVALSNTALSIAIDGEGRIDEIIIGTKGASGEKSEEEKKRLNLP